MRSPSYEGGAVTMSSDFHHVHGTGVSEIHLDSVIDLKSICLQYEEMDLAQVVAQNR